MEPSKEANLELAMLDSRVGVKLFVRVCDWANDVFSLVKIHRTRFLLANGFNVLVLRGLFFVCKSQYL